MTSVVTACFRQLSLISKHAVYLGLHFSLLQPSSKLFYASLLFLSMLTHSTINKHSPGASFRSKRLPAPSTRFKSNQLAFFLTTPFQIPPLSHNHSSRERAGPVDPKHITPFSHIPLSLAFHPFLQPQPIRLHNIPLTHSFPTHLSFTSHSTVFQNFPYFLKTILTAYSYSPLLTPYLYLSFFYYTSLSHSYPSPSPTLLSPTNPVHFRYSSLTPYPLRSTLQQLDLTLCHTTLPYAHSHIPTTTRNYNVSSPRPPSHT